MAVLLLVSGLVTALIEPRLRMSWPGYERRLIEGVAISATVVGLVYSRWGRTIRRAFQPGGDTHILVAREGDAVGRALLHGFPDRRGDRWNFARGSDARERAASTAGHVDRYPTRFRRTVGGVRRRILHCLHAHENHIVGWRQAAIHESHGVVRRSVRISLHLFRGAALRLQHEPGSQPGLGHRRRELEWPLDLSDGAPRGDVGRRLTGSVYGGRPHDGLRQARP